MNLNDRQHEELVGLLTKHKGRLTVEHVYEASKAKESTLHELVGWSKSNDALADAYRKEQARLVIMAMNIRQQEAENAAGMKKRSAADQARLREVFSKAEKRDVRRLISLESDRVNGGGYRDVAAMLATDDGRQELREQLLLEFERFISSRVAMEPEMHDTFREFLANVKAQYGQQLVLAAAGT